MGNYTNKVHVHLNNGLLIMVDAGDPVPKALLGTIVTEYTSPKKIPCSTNTLAGANKTSSSRRTFEMTVILKLVISGSQLSNWKEKKIVISLRQQ